MDSGVFKGSTFENIEIHHSENEEFFFKYCQRLRLAQRQFQYVVMCTWYLVLGTWYLVLGTWYMVHGTWYMVLGTWYMVLGTWSMVLGT